MKTSTSVQTESNTLFKTPFSVSYWKSALHTMRKTRILTATALLCALAALVDMFFLPIGGAFLRIQFSFLIAGLLSAVAGPILALPAGALVDTLSFILAGGDPAGYFPGYTLSSMCCYLIYALFFYRANLSLSRICAARMTVNVFINVMLGSVWKEMLYGKAYIVYFVSGAIKNIAMLPAELFLMIFLYRYLIPVLRRADLIPHTTEITVSKKDYLFSAIAALVGAAVLVVYYYLK